MSASPVSIPIDLLPRDIDVSVIIARPQYETASDLSMLCFVTPDANFPPNNGRVRNYATFDSVIKDTGWDSNDSGWWAAKAFFDQTTRPPKMSVGRVFVDKVQAQLMAATITNFDAIKTVSDGSFSLDLTDAGGVVVNIDIEAIDFTAITNLQSVVAAINKAITASGNTDDIVASVDYNGRLVISDKTDGVAISYATAGAAGTDVSALLYLTQTQGAQKWNAYTPGNLVSEIQNIALAARAGSFPVYAWAIDKVYRDTSDQRIFADWAETQGFKAMALICTNSQTAFDSQDTTNIGYYCFNVDYKASAVVYSDTPQQYPEIAYITGTLAVNYNIENSVITACHKDANGITPSSLTLTQHNILESRRINMFVRVGNNARTYRYAMQSSPSWWTDSYAGACNFREELQVAVCNALYRNKKLPYTTTGQNIIVSAIAYVCDRFKTNLYLADRDVQNFTNENGFSTIPAYKINPTPIYKATDTERESRTLPGIQVTIYEAGAIHKVNIAVDIIN